MSGFDIGGRHVGDGAPCLIVAEVGQAHEGSYGMAHAYIDAVAAAGADAVKFQCHLAEAESTPDEPWRVRPDWAQDESRFAYWKRMEFTPEQWEGLRQHAEDRCLIFLASPFSVEAVRLLDPLVAAWKVASGEVAHWNLLEVIGRTRKPVILSAGMATAEEIRRARGFISDASYRVQDDASCPLAVLLCTSRYPCPADQVGLDRLKDARWQWQWAGLSDHSGTIWPSLAAVALGAAIVEVHVCFSRQQFGFDVSSSVTVEELGRLVEGVRFIEKAMQPVDKDALARDLEPMRRLFMDRHLRRARA